MLTVSFFGHRQMDRPMHAEVVLEQAVSCLLRQEEYVEFLVGRKGDFDYLAAAVVRRCRQRIRSDNSALTLILPYETAELRRSGESLLSYYDGVEINPFSAGLHPKAVWQRHNRSLVDRSDLLLFYVEREAGGAWQTLRYAQRIRKRWVNLAEPFRQETEDALCTRR